MLRVRQMLVNNILDFIGNTPLVRINHLNPNPKLELFMKLEKFNPGGSVKDRVTKYMIEPAPHTSLGWAGSGVHAVNMNAWKSLPDDLKEIFRVAARAHALNVYIGCLEDDLVARKKMIDYGLKVLTIPPAEFAKIIKAARESTLEFAKKNETAAKLVKTFQECLDLYSKRTGFAQ